MNNLTVTENDLFNTDVATYFEESEEYKELIHKIDSALEESSEVVVFTINDVNKASHYIRNYKTLGKKIEQVRKNVKQPIIDKGKEVDAFFKNIPLKFQGELKRLETEILDYQEKERQEAKRKADAERKKAEEEAIQRGIEEEEKQRKRIKVIETILESAKEMKAETPEITSTEIRSNLESCKGFPNDITEDEWKYILGESEKLEAQEIEPPVVAEVIPEESKISTLNTSGVHTRKTKTFKIINESLIPREYLIPDEKKIRAERMKYPAANDDGTPVKSTIPGVEFTFDESVV